MPSLTSASGRICVELEPDEEADDCARVSAENAMMKIAKSNAKLLDLFTLQVPQNALLRPLNMVTFNWHTRKPLSGGLS
jgi:hypothetical protein